MAKRIGFMGASIRPGRGLTILFVIIAALTLLGAGCRAIVVRDTQTGKLPTVLRAERVLATQVTSGGLQVCMYVAYKLDAQSTIRLQNQGLALLRDVRPERDGGRYGAWRVTPYDPYSKSRGTKRDSENPGFFALQARSGCGDGRRDRRPLNAEDMLRKAGNFFTVTENDEGMLIVDPAAGTALFLYDG